MSRTIDLLPPVNGWDSLALAIPGGMPTEGNLPTAMVVLRFAGSASARFSPGSGLLTRYRVIRSRQPRAVGATARWFHRRVLSGGRRPGHRPHRRFSLV